MGAAPPIKRTRAKAYGLAFTSRHTPDCTGRTSTAKTRKGETLIRTCGKGSAGTGKVNVEAGSVREAGIFPDKRATRLVNAAGDIGTSREAGGFSESARQARTFLDPIPAMLI